MPSKAAFIFGASNVIKGELRGNFALIQTKRMKLFFPLCDHSSKGERVMFGLPLIRYPNNQSVTRTHHKHTHFLGGSSTASSSSSSSSRISCSIMSDPPTNDFLRPAPDPPPLPPLPLLRENQTSMETRLRDRALNVFGDIHL